MAVIRPHEIRLDLGAGPGVVESIHRNGPLSRIAIRLHRRVIEVLQSVDDIAPRVGTPCTLDLSRGRLYAGNPTP